MTSKAQEAYELLDRDPVAAFSKHANPAASDVLSRLPDHMRPGIVRYVLFGVTPGAFLRAVFSDEQEIAANRADSINRILIDRYRDFLELEAPQNCWGSSDKVRAWCEQGGLFGKEQVLT